MSNKQSDSNVNIEDRVYFCPIGNKDKVNVDFEEVIDINVKERYKINTEIKGSYELSNDWYNTVRLLI